MNDEERIEWFSNLMTILGLATGKDFSADERAAWYGLLSDFGDLALEQAFRQVAKTCKTGFPTVGMVNDAAAAAESGVTDTQGDTFARVAEAMRRCGPCLPCEPRCDSCREDMARKHIGEVGWKAIRALGGWSSVCNTEKDGMSTLRAHFRDAYQAAAAQEQRDRLLPPDLRPRIDNSSSRPSLEQPKSAPALEPPRQPTPEELERVKTLRIFREADPAPDGKRPWTESELESAKRQAEWLRRQIEKRGE